MEDKKITVSLYVSVSHIIVTVGVENQLSCEHALVCSDWAWGTWSRFIYSSSDKMLA